MKVAINGLGIDNKKAGVGNYAYNLIKQLKCIEGQECTFFMQSSVDIDGSNIIRVNDFDKSYKRILTEQLWLPSQFKKFDLAHFLDYSSPFFQMTTPFISTIHDLSFYKYPDTFSFASRKLKTILTPLSIQRATIVIADSISTKNDIVDMFPKVENKVRVVYPGVESFIKVHDLNAINKVKIKYGINNKYILAVGTVEPRKNLKRLIEAFDYMQTENNGVQMVIVGKLGWLYDDILDKANKLISMERLIFTNYISEEELQVLYSGAECFVYPSLYEGFGLPPLEAMCCGTPVVVSNSSSLPEVVGDAGVYVNPFSIDSIIEGISRVLKNDTLKEELIVKGYRQAEKFSWKKTASQVMDVYREILE